MFEHLFPDAIKRREQQLALDTYKATEEYKQMRRDNPNMLSRVIDFSNPDSVAGMQQPNQILNPFGNTNPYSNPNLVAQNPGMDYNSYAAPAYGTWYGGGGWYGGSDNNSKYLEPAEGEPRGKIVTRDELPVLEHTPIEQKEAMFEECMKTVHIGTGRDKGAVNLGIPKEETTPSFRIVKAAPRPHTPGQPYTAEELNPDYNQMKMIPDTPLNWTARDEEELDKLCHEIAVYDCAMAHVAWNIPTFEGCTREDYGYMKRYFRARIDDFRQRELVNQNFDYRAPYRYRKTPATVEEDGELMPDLSIPVPIPIRFVSPSGAVEYDYDRGTDTIPMKDWDIFIDRAYVDMLNGCRDLKAKDLLMLNQPMQPKKKQQPKQESYNPYDPIAVRLHNMREAQDNYQRNMDFWKYVYRNTMTPEQFDNWWYGTKTNVSRLSGRQMDSKEAHQAWVNNAVAANIRTLEGFVPYDPVAIGQRLEARQVNALREFSNNSFRKDMSLAEYMEALAYMDARIHELNVYEQMQQRQQDTWSNMSHNTFNTALNQYILNSYNYTNNPNPYHNSPWGVTTDPRVPSNGQFIDLNNNPLAQQKKAEFLEHCHTFKGQVPMSPVYR